MVKLALFLAAVAFFLLPQEAGAQVVINEVLPDPVGDDSGSEWVELYNSGSVSEDISGYKLKDALSHEQIINSGSIPPHGWLSVHSQGSFSLNNSGQETVNLYNSLAPDPISTFIYTGSTEAKSWGRIPDGGAIFSSVLEPTEGAANIAPTATPAPTGTPTPEPTAAPTLTPTPAPTKTPTSKPTPKPTQTQVPVEESTPEGLISAPVVLSTETEETPIATEAAYQTGFNIPLPAIFLMGGGGVLVIAAGVLFARQRHTKYANVNGNEIRQ